MFHLFFLNYAIYIGKCIELPLFFLPAWLLRARVLNPMLRATKGSIVGGWMAMEKGWAINLSGGYHHASAKRGSGFCVYADITLCVHFV